MEEGVSLSFVVINQWKSTHVHTFEKNTYVCILYIVDQKLEYFTLVERVGF